jgi:hypothetical protein
MKAHAFITIHMQITLNEDQDLSLIFGHELIKF